MHLSCSQVEVFFDLSVVTVVEYRIENGKNDAKAILPKINPKQNNATVAMKLNQLGNLVQMVLVTFVLDVGHVKVKSIRLKEKRGAYVKVVLGIDLSQMNKAFW